MIRNTIKLLHEYSDAILDAGVCPMACEDNRCKIERISDMYGNHCRHESPQIWRCIFCFASELLEIGFGVRNCILLLGNWDSMNVV